MKFYKFSLFNGFYKEDYKFIKRLLFDAFKQRKNLDLNGAKRELKRITRQICASRYTDLIQIALSMFYGVIWEKNRKPFYRVYPGVIEALKDIELSRLFSFEKDAKPIESLVIEFPVDYPVIIDDTVAGCIQYSCYIQDGQKIIYILVQDKDGDTICLSECSADLLDKSIKKRNRETRIWSPKHLDKSHYNPVSESLLYWPGYSAIIDILGGILMLEKSPELFEPAVLSRDIDNYKNADNKRKEFIVDRAKRNGVNGFYIGRMIPTKKEMMKMREQNQEAEKKGMKAPHIRIAHLHTFWTGEGKTTPIIKLIQTMFIHKEDLFNIPQNYYGNKERG